MSTNLGTIYYEVDAKTGQLLTVQREVDRATGKMEKDLERVDSAATQASKSLSKLSSIASALGAAMAAKKIIEYANAWQEVNNRLINSIRAGESLADVNQRVFQIAQNSRSDLDATADLYGKLERSTRDAGLSTKALGDMVETINKTFRISGASAAEAEGGIRQLGQSLAKGVLNGDEFNSVTENATRLSEGLAKSLGVSSAEMRKMAAEGKITSEAIIKALKEMKAEVDAEFSKLTPTMQEAFTVAGNNAAKFFGSNSSIMGGIGAFNSAVVTLSENLNEIATAFIGLATVMGGRVVNKFVAATAEALTNAQATRAQTAAARQAAQSELALANAQVISARQSVAAAAARLREAQAYAAANAGTKFEVQTLKELAVAKAQNTAASNALTAAEQRLAAAHTAAAANAGLLKTAFSATLGAIGGIPGALMLAVYGLTAYVDHVDQTAEANRNLADSVDVSTESLERMSKAAKLAGADKLQISMGQLEEDIDSLNKQIDQDTQALELNKRALENAEEGSRAYANLSKANQEITARLTREEAQREDILDRLNQMQRKYILLMQDTDPLMKTIATSLGLVADAYGRITTEAERAAAATQHASAALNADQQELMNLANRRLELAKLDSKTASREKAIDGFKREAEKANLTGEAYEKYMATMTKAYDTEQKRAEAERKASHDESEKKKHLKEAERLRKELEKRGQNVADKYNVEAAAQRKLKEDQKALNAALESGKISAEQYNKAWKELIGTEEQRKRQAGWDNLVNKELQVRGQVDPIQQAQNEWAVRKQMLTDLGATEQYIREQEKAHAQEMLSLEWERYKAQSMSNQLLGDTVDAMSGSATNALVGLVNGTQSWQQALANIGNTILSSVIGTLVQMGAEWVKQQLIGEAASAAATAKAMGEAVALSSAWSTPAYLASVATMGGAATAGSTAMATGLAGAKALALGGARYNGGAVNGGSLYRVGEHGKPEIFQSRNGEQYMIPGDNGRVIPNRDIGGGGGVNMPVTINITAENGWTEQDSAKLQETMKKVAMGVVREQSTRPGGMIQPRKR
ncbi:TPA: tape measure protein [Escherichia coli]